MSTKLPKVIYWNNIPSPYVVGRFNAIASRGNISLDAWFSEQRLPDRSWDVTPADWGFAARYIEESTKIGRGFRLPLSDLKRSPPDVFVSLFSEPSFIVGHLAASAYAGRTAFRVLPTFDTWFPRTRFKESVKNVLFRNVDGVKVSGIDGARQAMSYGVPDDRIFPVKQTIDVEHYSMGASIKPEEKTQERVRLGLNGFVFIYVGRLWKQKGLDYLLEAFSQVRSLRQDVSLLIVGDGIDEEYYKKAWNFQPGVVWAGFVQPTDVPRYLGLSDALVFPTLGDPNGLVVEEAMAAGLPVISTTSAGDISRRLDDSKMGFLVPPASATALTKRMLDLVGDPLEASRMGRNGQQQAMKLGHDQYAIDFERFVEGILTLPARRNPLRVSTRLGGRMIPLQHNGKS